MTPRESRIKRDRELNTAAERAVAYFHPGPTTYVIPDRQPETAAENLARIEREFLDMAVKHHVDNFGGKLRDKAIAVLVQRAIVNG